MSELDNLLEKNSEWANAIKNEDPDFFSRLSKQQTPEYLWIGCSDSRVPPNQIMGLLPGELFVHRNIANVVVHTDLNSQSVLEYAVKALKVKHVIVCGHYGCGGVAASMQDQQVGVIDNWLRNIRDVYYSNLTAFKGLQDDNARVDRLCELNVAQQVANVAHTNVVQNAWKQGQELSIHGWIYDMRDGLLKKLTKPVNSADGIPEQYRLK